jgi:phage terminase large subunit-like protein
MVRNNAILSKTLKIVDSQKRIINHRNGGFYRVLSSDVKTKHGINPSCILFDELHAQPNDNLWRVLTSGTDYARSQQLIFVFTTAGVYNKESIWWRVREKARQVRDGIIKDSSFLPVLFIADPEKDRVDDEDLWVRVNPSIGHIFTIEKIRKDYETARLDHVELQDFKRFRLNIPIKSLSRWMPMGNWDLCKKEEISEEDLEGRVCAAGIDLSSTTDLTAKALVFPPLEEDGNWIIKIKCYCPADTILDRSRQDKVHYNIWSEQGFITATPGNFVDYAFVKRDLLEDARRYDLREVAYDPWGASQLAGELQNEHGLTMTETRQGSKTLSEPAKDILKKVLAGKINHGGHPVLRWAADNLVMVVDANENIRPAKDKATDRIDPFVAVLNAWTRAMFIEPSVYEGRGVVIIE